MKSLIVIALLMTSVSSFASGYGTQSFSKIFYAASEAELVADVEAAIPMIEAGQDKKLSSSMWYQACRPIAPRHIKIGELFVKKVYSMVDGVLAPKFAGTLVISHNRCLESSH